MPGMLTGLVSWLADPANVARFQRLCGVELIPDEVHTCAGPTDPRPGATANPRASLSTGRQDDRAVSGAAPGASELRQRHTQQNHNNNNNHDGEKSCNGVAANGLIRDGSCANHVDAPRQAPATRQCCAGGVRVIDSNGGTDTVDLSSKSNGADCKQNGHVMPSEHQNSSTSFTAIQEESATHSSSKEATHPPTCSSETATRPGKTATRISIRYRPLYYLAQIGAILGNEEFYLSVLPFMLWAVDSVIIRQTAMVWCLVMYVGQATKDYLRWPRPPSPPVIRLESQHLQEFSMPSTHAMAGTAIPLVLGTMLLDRYQLPLLPVLAVGFLWCSTTCLSRLYLGVHTVLDLVCGILFALLIYVFFFPLMGRYDHYQQTHPLAPLILAATSLALCTVCYPSSHKNSAQGDAVQITSVLVGVGTGAWLNCQLGFSVEVPVHEKIPVTLPTLYWLLMSVLQFVLGVVVVFGVKAVVKFLSVRFFCAFFGLDKVDSQNQSVMIGYKYTTYLTLGLTISFLNPLLFSFLGIVRPGYYMEIV